MNVIAVADDFRRDFFALQDGAGQARCAMSERRHAVEQMRRMLRAGRDRLRPASYVAAGVPQRHPRSMGRDPSNQIEAALELGSQRDDADVGARAFDFGSSSAAENASPSF